MMNDTTVAFQTDTLTGSSLWELPDSEYHIVWNGPGAPLILTKKISGGRMTPVDFDGKSKVFVSHGDAQAGFDIFLALTKARRSAQQAAVTERPIRTKRKITAAS
jgi:hypothetical protein